MTTAHAPDAGEAGRSPLTVTGGEQVLLNVRDLEGAVAFFEALTTYRCTAELDDAAVTVEGGVPGGGRFDACVLEDPGASDEGTLLLARWRDPEPVGDPYPTFFDVGWVKMTFSVLDLDVTIGRMLELGLVTEPPRTVRRYASLCGPDGQIVSFVQDRLGEGERLVHACNSGRDTARATRFYNGLLDLPLWTTSASDVVQPIAHGPGAEEATWDSALFRRAPGTLAVDCTTIRTPGPVGEPHAELHHIGIAEVAARVDDLGAAAASAELAAATAAGEAGRGPVEHWDLGPLGQRRVLPLRDPDGSRFSLYEVA
jgi:catechol 2,3-dioxygenase-like lactoylglutathione lyase family enzyme